VHDPQVTILPSPWMASMSSTISRSAHRATWEGKRGPVFPVSGRPGYRTLRGPGRCPVGDALRRPVGEKERYVDRAMANITPHLPANP
jgi:hypothetical protein